jgi:hypothetical protein
MPTVKKVDFLQDSLTSSKNSCTALVRTIEIAGIPAIFSPNFRRNSGGIIEICIFQKFLPFPVFLVDNFKLFFNFPCQMNIRIIFEKTLSLKKFSRKPKFVKYTNLNDLGGIPTISAEFRIN